MCRDTEGSFACTCGTGYQGSGVQCAPICGDSKRYGAEQCDDGNSDSADGCSSACVVEPYFNCENGSTSTPDRWSRLLTYADVC